MTITGDMQLRETGPAAFEAFIDLVLKDADSSERKRSLVVAVLDPFGPDMELTVKAGEERLILTVERGKVESITDDLSSAQLALFRLIVEPLLRSIQHYEVSKIMAVGIAETLIGEDEKIGSMLIRCKVPFSYETSGVGAELLTEVLH